MEDKGFIIVGVWRSASGHAVPASCDGERVLFGTHVDRGLSLPLPDLLVEVLNYYYVQLHNLPPNSLLELSTMQLCARGFLALGQVLTFSGTIMVPEITPLASVCLKSPAPLA